MNLRDIEYILSSYETGTFAKASKLCHISQPSLSIQIGKVEKELGHRIFIRQQSGVKLTDFGEKILPLFQEIQRNVSSIENCAKTYDKKKTVQIRLGAIFTAAPFVFPYISEMEGIVFEESNTADLLSKLLNNKIDAAIMALPVNAQVFSTRKILREPFYLAAAKKNKMINKINFETMTAPKGCQFVALTEEHCLGEQVKDICYMFGRGNKSIIEKASIETIRRSVALSNYITLMPQMAIRKNDGLKYKKLPGKYYRDIGLVYKKHSPFQEQIFDVYQHIKKKLSL